MKAVNNSAGNQMRTGGSYKQFVCILTFVPFRKHNLEASIHN